MKVENRHSMINYMRIGLERDIKEALYKDIMDSLLAQVRIDIDKQLKPLVNSLVLDRLERFCDMSDLRDELKIYIEIKGKSETGEMK